MSATVEAPAATSLRIEDLHVDRGAREVLEGVSIDMQTGGLTAELPAGRLSERPSPAPLRKKDSLPATADAPPDSDHPAPPASKPPSGAST